MAVDRAAIDRLIADVCAPDRAADVAPLVRGTVAGGAA